MRKIHQVFCGLGFTLFMALNANVMAQPAHLTIQNNTDVDSNAVIIAPSGKQRVSTHPTLKHSPNELDWSVVRNVCAGFDPCTADIYVKTQSAQVIKDVSINLARVSLNMQTGDISIVDSPVFDPQRIVSGNTVAYQGYRLTVSNAMAVLDKIE